LKSSIQFAKKMKMKRKLAANFIGHARPILWHLVAQMCGTVINAPNKTGEIKSK